MEEKCGKGEIMIRKKRDLSPDAKLRFPDYLGYFFGAGTNIAGYIVSAFLLIYYSNVLYLGLTQVGVVMAISKCFDGVSDILMGRIIDKTKSKYGKARPWYLRMILPLSMCMLFLFWMPPGLSETWKYVYVFITYNLASTVCFTANAIAHSSMIGFMTMDTRSRGIVGVMSMISNTVFTILVTNFFMKICKFFGGGETYTQRGFTLTILVYLVFYAAAAVLAFLLTRERIHNVSDSESRETEDTLTKQEKEKKETVHREAEVPFWTAIRSLFTNKYWILCLVMCLGFYFLMSYASSADSIFCAICNGGYQSSGNIGFCVIYRFISGYYSCSSSYDENRKKKYHGYRACNQCCRMVSAADYFRKDDCYCSFCNCGNWIWFHCGTCGKLSAGYTYLWNLEERCDSNRNGKCSVLFCK